MGCLHEGFRLNESPSLNTGTACCFSMNSNDCLFFSSMLSEHSTNMWGVLPHNCCVDGAYTDADLA